MSEPLKNKFAELMVDFDKKYIEELFEEGMKAGLHNPNNLQHMYRYDYNGYRYIISRVHLGVLSQLDYAQKLGRG